MKFVKVMDELGEALAYIAFYKGKPIASGTANEVWKTFKNAFNKTKKALDDELAKISKSKKRTYGEGAVDEFTTPMLTSMKELMIAEWTKRGIAFEIGTDWAKTVLSAEGANGLVKWAKDVRSGKIKITIFLYEPFGAATFMEECRHAIQWLEKHVQYRDVVHNGRKYTNIDFYEYEAKQMVLMFKEELGLTNSEINYIELQLKDVLNKRYK